MATMATQLAVAPGSPTESLEFEPTHREIAALAYTLWKKRGCPHGSADEDWYEAERRLKIYQQIVGRFQLHLVH